MGTISESRRYDELSALVDEAFARRNGLILNFDHRQAIVEGRFFTTVTLSMRLEIGGMTILLVWSM